MKKTISIVDDHTLVAKGLAELINSYEKYEVINILKNGRELVDYLTQSNVRVPDLILLDVKMPIMDGKSTMKWIKKFRPEIPVLVISMEDDDDTIISMIKDGAKGYLLKDTEPDILLTALNTIMNKGYFHSDLVTHTLMHALDGKEEIVLKDREIEFLKLVCEEKTYKEIADEMFLSTHTIDNYREALFSKLGVKSRTGLVIYAIKNGIVSL